MKDYQEILKLYPFGLLFVIPVMVVVILRLRKMQVQPPKIKRYWPLAVYPSGNRKFYDCVVRDIKSSPISKEHKRFFNIN